MPPARFSKRSGAGGVGLHSREMKITPTLERANSVTVDTRQIDAATSGSARAHCA